MKVYCVTNGLERTDLDHVVFVSTNESDAERFAYSHELYDYSGNPNIEVLDVPVKNKAMKTYEDIYKEFCAKFPNLEVVDYRSATETYVAQLSTGIPNAIIVWLKGGSYVIYKAESEV